ncbi:hypothetical protein BDC45DRAFT_539470 [Circinella umbellata]|nr:hypothetical protein BDC45DRAFT_539470 [Circinella umbellata]
MYVEYLPSSNWIQTSHCYKRNIKDPHDPALFTCLEMTSLNFDDAFFKQQKPNIKEKYEELLLKKPSLLMRMTADMILTYDKIEVKQRRTLMVEKAYADDPHIQSDPICEEQYALHGESVFRPGPKWLYDPSQTSGWCLSSCLPYGGYNDFANIKESKGFQIP